MENALVPVNNNSKRIILHSGGSRVFYDTQSNRLELIRSHDQLDTNVRCYACGQLLPVTSDAEAEDEVHHETSAETTFVDSNYFRLLASIFRKSAGNYPITIGPPQKIDTIEVQEIRESSENLKDQTSNLPPNVLNQGYYEKFFRETRQLGRGYRGAVFECQHVLDNVVLGEYAVKKIPIGDNKEWMLRMLREVYTLEQMRHFNVIEYRHCWIEDARLSTFGPSVPCLFLLMELANGGNLEEYMAAKMLMKRRSTESSPVKSSPAVPVSRRTLSFTQYTSDSEDTEPSPQMKKSPALSIGEIWSFFLDICNGLEHLHSHGIIHRDLKPSNLILSFPADSKKKLDDIPRVLISDFGESENLRRTSFVTPNRTGHTGTVEFTAPELLKTDVQGKFHVEHTPASDIWSLGLVLYYMCFSSLPYQTAFTDDSAAEFDVDALKAEILEFKSSSTPLLSLSHLQSQRPDLPPQLFKLIKLMLSMNPRDRPSAKDILTLLSTLSDSVNSHSTRRKSETTSHRETQRAIVSPRTPQSPDSLPKTTVTTETKPAKPRHVDNFEVLKLGLMLGKVSILLRISPSLLWTSQLLLTPLALADTLLHTRKSLVLTTVLFFIFLIIITS